MQNIISLNFRRLREDGVHILPPLLTESTIISHIEYTIHAEEAESTPPLNGKKNPPWQDRLKYMW